MSWIASNVVTRSYGPPVKVCAEATWNETRSLTPASVARCLAWSIEPSW
jgi:hypothetical protein